MGRVINLKRQEQLKKVKRVLNPKRKLKIKNRSSYLKVGDTLKIQNPSHARGYYKISSLTGGVIYLEDNPFLRVKFHMEELYGKILLFKKMYRQFSKKRSYR
ncbi:hypothetical protein [Methanobacterium aggregans]|uniref:hypothetical protein n=1 Tax=Methanobacterium aggregans TaxID=1615586 RepID=UPI001AE42939|nr:hypothetical protein [Methanobacterium aggregans]MBP2046902.1 hypothetical protein [Methanobacterium aggregans]